MIAKNLSSREEQIVQLCVAGMTNEGIAHELNLSIGTVNTYWLRIRLKVGGSGKTETVARIIKERSEAALRAANVERQDLEDLLVEKTRHVVELRAAVALLHLAMDQIKSTVWATDLDLVIYMVANGEFPSTHFGVVWEEGKTIYQIFKATNKDDAAVAAHLAALRGQESTTRLSGEYENMTLRVMPLHGDNGEILGCISILHTIGGNTA